MSNKIAIIEPLKHYEVLASILRASVGDQIEIHCFTNAFCKKHIKIKNENIKWYVEKKDFLSTGFLLKNLETLNSCDTIFFTTIDFQSSIWKDGVLKASIHGLIHNSNNFFFYKKIKSNNQIRHGYNNLRGDFRKAKKVLDRLDRVVLPSKFIEAHIRKEWDGDLQKLKTIDIAVPEFHPSIFKRDKVIISIPGTINQDRRDYQRLLEVLPKIDKKISRPVELVFLGRIYSNKEETTFKKMSAKKLKHFDLITFDKYVPIGTYKKYMFSTDFLLLPIQQYITYKSMPEERGKTCVSGNINDMVQYGLPAILPDFYPLKEKWKPMIDTFKTNIELEEILVDWINNNRFNEKKSLVQV